MFGLIFLLWSTQKISKIKILLLEFKKKCGNVLLTNYFECIKYSEFMIMIIIKNNLRELCFGTGSSQNLDEISSLEPLTCCGA